MIIKTKKGKSKDFTVVPNSILTDERISYKARGILMYLLSKPENWIVRVQDIANQAPDMGLTAVRSALKELEAFGYARLEQVRENGRAMGKSWVVYEEPIQTCRKPESQKSRKSGNLKVRKPQGIVNTDLLVNKEEIKNKELFSLFYSSYPRKVNKSKSAELFNALTSEQQQNAIDGIEQFVKGKDLTYLVGSEKYLEGEHWNDKPVQAPVKKKPKRVDFKALLGYE